jgi:aspartate carbamoyltransferase regulatory subunit
MLTIGGLNHGLVIDHIKAGGAMKIYEYLNLDSLNCQIAIIKNAKSLKMGVKDIIKIDGDIDVDFDMLGVLDPNITLDFIENGVITKKLVPQLPDIVVGIIKCKNPRCITSIEQGLVHKFKLTNSIKGIYRCMYCEQAYARSKESDSLSLKKG